MMLTRFRVDIALEMLKNKNVQEAKEILEDAAWKGNRDAVKIMLAGFGGKYKNKGFMPDRASEILYFAIAEQLDMPKYGQILKKIANQKKRNADSDYLDNADAIVLKNTIAYALADADENHRECKCLVITQKNADNTSEINLTVAKSFDFDAETKLLMLDESLCYRPRSLFVTVFFNRIKNYPLTNHAKDCTAKIVSFLKNEKNKLLNDFDRICFVCDDEAQMIKDKTLAKDFTSSPQKDENISDVKVDVKVSKAKLMELLQCSQCGNTAIDTSNHVDGFVFCSSCGSKYAFNKGALGPASSIGLDFNEAKMNMPDGASIPQNEFALRSILNNKLSIVMPKAFVVMDEQAKKIKYPSENRPQLVYTDSEGTVNMTFSLLTNYEMSNDIVEEATNQITTIMTSIDRSLKILERDTLNLNGITLSYFNFISRAIDFDIYNSMFIMPLSGYMLQGSLNCLAKDRWYWRSVFNTIIHSVSENK